MAKSKSPESQVKEVYPKAEHVGLGFGKFMVHSIYTDSNWKTLLGQSSSSRKHAWEVALQNINTSKK